MDSALNTHVNSDGPLAGLRVLELGSTVAGPFCGRLLADFGAQVVKVEPPEGDPLRTMGEHIDGKSLYAATILRSKSLVTIDLRQPQGRELARSLALEADIIVENFRPGTLEKWELGYDELAKINPRLIMVRISGFGQTGPYRYRAGYGVIGEAVSGVREMTGDADRPPARVAVSMTDYLTGLYAAFGAVMAVTARNRTGTGQVVDAALYESAFSLMEPFIPAFDLLGTLPSRSGSRLPGSTPNNLYSSREGRYLHLAAMADAVFARLAGAIGNRALIDDPRFATAKARNQHVDVLDELVAQWCAEHSLEALELKLQQADVPASRIFNLADIFADPHYQARQMLPRVEDPDLGPVAMAGVVPRLSGTPGRIRHTGRRRGSDTRAVLQDWLGLKPAAIDALIAAGTVGEAAP
jgi:crotonobetainyl-CoA:carnitine CoA-transferase CaiB-like acyl-CoA transferase